jgi:rhodanese-related sulfurtransferase/broad specificity phosphatase PhoE
MHLARILLLMAGVLPSATAWGEAQQAIYVVRHADQVQDVEDPPLTQAGRQRAQALVDFLREAGITAVYSSQARRTRETAQPMAEALGTEVRQVPREDTEGLIERIRREESAGRVLVVAHTETVPGILRALGHAGPIRIERGDHDNVYVVVPVRGGAPTVLHHRFRPAEGVFRTTVPEESSRTPQVSTEELKGMLAAGNAVVLDTRPRMEWAVSHLPGALNVAPRPGMPMHLHTSDVAEVERLVAGDKTKRLVLYCNGPFCGKSNRVAEDLLEAGFQDVRRYQLGAPVWRSLGGVMVIEPEGARYVFEKDRTAVWIDARDPAQFRAGSVPGAVNLSRSGLRPGKDQGEVMAAKDDGRLPMEDHNTRIIVFGADAQQARAVAEAIAREAFHNVSYFEGSADTLRTALR